MIGDDRTSSKALVAYVVDLDHTLVGINTAYEFLKILCPLKYMILSRLLFPFSFLNHILRRDLFKFIMMKLCVRNFGEKEIKLYAQAYYRKYIPKHLNTSLTVFLQTQKGLKVLLTASIDLIADNLKELGFDIIISTKSFFKKGRYYTILDLYGKKGCLLQVVSKYFSKIIVFDDAPEQSFYKLNNVVVVKIRYDSSEQNR
ncbi:MAG: hypothetical protein B7O98_08990 [Zestosphaera tikiterensis]|uniref:Haloacid dehalogenase-like hydrolase n=1 Tax=Zestosphaera tikiterensis TaxID=1973259 RepID=A0A2R7Y272_9CREN|nr:MAG: hypothetical protein B7O98_08990 [Zestosphaera tikiterensis]